MKKKIIASKPMDEEHDLVICYLEDNKVTPFVAWHKKVGEENYFWGHYHATLEGALKYFDSKESYYFNAEQRFTKERQLA